MKRHGQNARNGRGRPRGRMGTRAVALVATFALVMSMCPGAAALAYANGQLAGGTAVIEAQGDAARLSAQADEVTIVTPDTHTMSTGTYKVTGNVTIEPGWSGNGIEVDKGAKVLLIIEEGATLTVNGREARTSPAHPSKRAVGHAAILLPEGSTLTVAGEGTLNAQGGRALDGEGGSSGQESGFLGDDVRRVGRGGWAGQGGGGAGAGIGTDGGYGGWGDMGGDEVSITGLTRSNVYGHEGRVGLPGDAADPAGTLIVTGSVTVNAKGGAAGNGGAGGRRGKYYESVELFVGTSFGTSGGGGGGGGGTAADGIGSGGTGGGGGGSGASANIDGECAYFEGCDLDDLWGHGGSGGNSTWGGTAGSKGDEGASGNGDDTDASKKYAKAGGAGGSCVAPKTVAFYTYKDSGDSKPTVNCTSGHGVTRSAIALGSLREFVDRGGVAISVTGGTSTYDGKPHGVTVDPGKLSAQSDSAELGAQADADEGEWPDSGTFVIDDVEVSYVVAYYDEAGEKLLSAPVMPGSYAAVVTFSSESPDYCGDWVETIVIAKRPVGLPNPAALEFSCEDWETGEGALQDAFAGVESADYEFDGSAVSPDGTTSLRSARAAGGYEACFRLTDPETCEWADGTAGAEAWVPWSVALAPFGPNDPGTMYWGAAYDSDTTTVTYAGEPTWVRPWFTYAKDSGGEFPEWFTHWGDEGRPTTDKGSACVFYLSGDDDQEGLVGYHENADGSLEKVTAAQVYAWLFGVDVDGRHVDVKSGQRVWYRTGEDGWWVPVAVGGKRPAGAEGSIVARDYAYVTRLGVMDAGTYEAYALFDEGAGFASTDLAMATVRVTKAANTMSAKAKAVTASAKKGGSFAAADAFRVSKAQGKVAFQKASGSKKVFVAKSGEVTVAAGLKAGKTYRVEVDVTAKGDANHKKATEAVTLKVKVK